MSGHWRRSAATLIGAAAIGVFVAGAAFWRHLDQAPFQSAARIELSGASLVGRVDESMRLGAEAIRIRIYRLPALEAERAFATCVGSDLARRSGASVLGSHPFLAEHGVTPFGAACIRTVRDDGVLRLSVLQGNRLVVAIMVG